MDDSKIVELFFERSEQAIVELSKKYGNGCQRLAENILKNPCDVEECINDAYLGVWNTIPPERPQSLRAYLFGILRNISTNRYHYNTAQKRNSFYDAALDEIEAFIPSAETVEDSADAAYLAKGIDDFLENLSEKEQVMFVKRYYFSDDIRQIAKDFEKSERYISVRLFRIRKKLEKFLNERGIFI